MEELARGLVVDLAPIQVNLVSPGAISTELLKCVLSPQMEESYAKKTLVKRIGRSEDTAKAYLYMMRGWLRFGHDAGYRRG